MLEIKRNEGPESTIKCWVDINKPFTNSTEYRSYPIMPNINYEDVYGVLCKKVLPEICKLESLDVDSLRKIIAKNIQSFILDLDFYCWDNVSFTDKFIRVIENSNGISVNGLVVDAKERPEYTSIINGEPIDPQKFIESIKGWDNVFSAIDIFYSLQKEKSNFFEMKERIKTVETLGFYIIIDNNIYYISKEDYDSRLYPKARSEGVKNCDKALNWTPIHDNYADLGYEGLMYTARQNHESLTILEYTRRVVENDKDYLENKPFFNLADIDTDRWTLEAFIKGMAEGDKEVFEFINRKLNPQDTDTKGQAK